MSPAKDLGTKYICWKCETKFYDLHKPVPICPKCGADQRDSPPVKSTRASRPAPKPVRAKAKEVAAPLPPEEGEEDAPPEEADDDDDEAEDEDDDEEP